jgi:hypothetical protein
MSSISSISSILSKYLLGTDTSTSTDLYKVLAGSTSASSIADRVSISLEAQNKITSLLSSLTSTSETSGSSLSDVLLSASNMSLIKHSYSLVNMILTVDKAEASDTTFSSITSSIKDINLVSMSSIDLLSIIRKYKTLSGSSTTQIDVSV